MSVTLIGMPSCGKSTLGVLLAKKLGYRFIDSDLLIQERENALLHDIIEEKGIDAFIQIENDVNCGITDYNYFSRVFKSKTGMTPRGYRHAFLNSGTVPEIESPEVPTVPEV